MTLLLSRYRVRESIHTVHTALPGRHQCTVGGTVHCSATFYKLLFSCCCLLILLIDQYSMQKKVNNNCIWYRSIPGLSNYTWPCPIFLSNEASYGGPGEEANYMGATIYFSCNNNYHKSGNFFNCKNISLSWSSTKKYFECALLTLMQYHGRHVYKKFSREFSNLRCSTMWTLENNIMCNWAEDAMFRAQTYS